MLKQILKHVHRFKVLLVSLDFQRNWDILWILKSITDPQLLVLALVGKLALSTLTLGAAGNMISSGSLQHAVLFKDCFLFLCTLLCRWQISTQPWILTSNFISLSEVFPEYACGLCHTDLPLVLFIQLYRDEKKTQKPYHCKYLILSPHLFIFN